MSVLSNRTALVTGASRGLGRATAARLARAGAASSFTTAPAALLPMRWSRDRAAGGRADALGADLAAPDGAHILAEAVKALGLDRLDILVANAGIAETAPIEQQTVRVLRSSVRRQCSRALLSRAAIAALLKEGSSVVLLSSVVARAAFEGTAIYSATKGAIETLTRVLAKELGPRGIRVIALAPVPSIPSLPRSSSAPRKAANYEEYSGSEADRAAGRYRRCGPVPRVGSVALGRRTVSGGKRRSHSLSRFAA